MREREDTPLDEFPAEMQGFEHIYTLLRSLTFGQDPAAFYERLHVLLLLSRWVREPLTMREMSRQVHLPLERLSSHVARLRASGWLSNEDRTYSLTTKGRLLIFVLRLLAQPWQDSDSVAFISQLYAAASTEELGLGPEHFFEDVVAALEASVRRLRRAVSAERTVLIGQYHEESSRNVRMADMALELRQQGVAANDFDSIARMHAAISVLSTLSGQFEQQHLTLLERDLLTSGQVTLGDVQMWAAQADDFACTAMIAPHLEQTIRQPWYLNEGKLVSADADIHERSEAISYSTAPPAQGFRAVESQTVLNPHYLHLSALQGQLRQRVLSSPGGLRLATWVQHDEWPEALVHMLAALDPLLRTGSDPVYLHIQPQAPFVALEDGGVQCVSTGTLNTEERFHDA